MRIGNEDYDLYRIMCNLYLICRDLEDMTSKELRVLCRTKNFSIVDIKKRTKSLLLAIEDIEHIQEDEKKPVIEN